MDLSPGQFDRAAPVAEAQADVTMLAAAARAEQAASPTAAAQAGLRRPVQPRGVTTRVGAFDARVAGKIAEWRDG